MRMDLNRKLQEAGLNGRVEDCTAKIINVGAAGNRE